MTNVKSKCGVCVKTVTGNCKAIYCEFECNQWFHAKCLGLSDSEYDRLAVSQEEWYCEKCGLKDAIQQLKVEILNLTKHISLLETDAKEYKALYEETVGRNTVLSEMCLKREQEIVLIKRELEHLRAGGGSSKPVKSNYRRSWAVRVNDRDAGVGLNGSLPVNTGDFPPLSIRNRFSCLYLGDDDVEHTMEGAEDCSTPIRDRGRSKVSMRRPTKKTRITTSLTSGDSIVNLGNNNRSNLNGPNRKSRRIKIYSDSFGRGLSSLIAELATCVRGSLAVEGTVKPGASFSGVTTNVRTECDQLGNNDYVVLLAGANDVAKNSSDNLVCGLKDLLGVLVNTNVICINVPHRYDLPAWSIINKEITETNRKLKVVCKNYKNVHFINVEKCNRLFHTRHGLHFNYLGKKVLANLLIKIIKITSIKGSKHCPVDGKLNGVPGMGLDGGQSQVEDGLSVPGPSLHGESNDDQLMDVNVNIGTTPEAVNNDYTSGTDSLCG